MLFDSVKSDSEEVENTKNLTIGALIVQAIATSIDALTAGIDLARDYSIERYIYVIIAVSIIAVLTFIICFSGVKLGQKMGTKLSNKAGILGGCVLIFLRFKNFYRRYNFWINHKKRLGKTKPLFVLKNTFLSY